jgi:NNP family nitrate/nitrite transporter-like MFS transporter
MIGVISQFNFQTKGPVLGWTSAIAAYGAFIIPWVFGKVIQSNGSPNLGLYIFAAFYAVSMVILWYFYLRGKAQEHGA